MNSEIKITIFKKEDVKVFLKFLYRLSITLAWIFGVIGGMIGFAYCMEHFETFKLVLGLFGVGGLVVMFVGFIHNLIWGSSGYGWHGDGEDD